MLVLNGKVVTIENFPTKDEGADEDLTEGDLSGEEEGLAMGVKHTRGAEAKDLTLF